MTLLLHNLRVVDTAARRVRAGSWVEIDGARIASVGSGPPPDGPADRVVDCGGRFAVPGLMDMHVHLRGANHRGPTVEQPVPAITSSGTMACRTSVLQRLHTFLYCGVTSVYDAGNDPELVMSLRRDERDGAIVSPRIYCTGSLVTCPGGHGAHGEMAVEISALPVDQHLLDRYLAQDPDMVKVTYDEHNWGVRPLIPILDQHTLRQIVERCHQALRRVTVHVSNELRAREAVSAGVDSLAHPVIQSPVTPEFVWLLAEKGLPTVSTLAIGERYWRLADHPEYVDEPLYAACMGEEERARLRTEESRTQRANPWAAWMKVMTPIAQENLRRLADAGAVVVTGTDLSFGPDFHRELRLLQDAGIAPMDILRAATFNAARLLGRESELGSIHAGCHADLVVVEGDPTDDVVNLQGIWGVVKGGQVLDRSTLQVPGQGDKRPDGLAMAMGSSERERA